MFGIGLPEMIVIFVVALIVVGPDKLPELARSLAKGMLEMKKTLNQVKESLSQDDGTLDSVRNDLQNTSDELRNGLIETDLSQWKPASGPMSHSHHEPVIDVEPEARAIEAELREHATSPTDDDPAASQPAPPLPPETAAVANPSAQDATKAS